jgi:hypothetical protein
MTPQAAGAVIEAMADAQKEGETLTVSLKKEAKGLEVAVVSASTTAMDAVSDNGYYLTTRYGYAYITDEED